ncbi:hypothetical protein [Alkalicoccus urumqiensis]|nr:hypothetical protein [Alkalicoccus urumqiensis]
MDPITLVLLVILIIAFFPLILRSVGCLLRIIAAVVIIAVGISLLSQLL